MSITQLHYTFFKGGRDANTIPNWSDWKVKMFECDCLPWFLLLFCMDQTIMLLILSLTHTHMYAHIRTNTHTPTPPHHLPSLFIAFAALSLIPLGSRAHQLPLYCLVGFVTYEASALFVAAFLLRQACKRCPPIEWFPCHIPNSSHLHTCTGARTKTFNAVRLLHDLHLLGLVSDPRWTTEKHFVCSWHDLEIIIFACVYVFPNCISMSKIWPLLFLLLQCLNNPADMEPDPRSDIYPCKVIQVRDKLLQSSRLFNVPLRFLTKWTL